MGVSLSLSMSVCPVSSKLYIRNPVMLTSNVDPDLFGSIDPDSFGSVDPDSDSESRG